MIKNKNPSIHRIHRYLGLFIGIQFLGWTISGLFFSWSDIHSVHGDHLRKSPAFISANVSTVSPTDAIEKLEQTQTVDSIHSVHLISVLNNPVCQIAYFSGHVGGGMHHHFHHALADAATGEVKQALTKEEGIAVAKEQAVHGTEVSEVLYLDQTDGHHEYREKPLPAWAVSFKNPDCTVFISAELGTFQSIRHDQWGHLTFYGCSTRWTMPDATILITGC